MEWIPIVLVAGATLGLCWLVDKGFTRLFRSQAQHKSGLAVRLNRKYGAFGLVFVALGIAAIFSGLGDSVPMIVGGSLIAAIGVGLVVYYMTFGVFYDQDTFLLTTFGKKSTVYHYRDIKCQQLYRSNASIVIELQMCDGRVVHLPANTLGVYPFLDHAFARWCAQKGIEPENCSFHDPENSLWFPQGEGA